MNSFQIFKIKMKKNPTAVDVIFEAYPRDYYSITLRPI